MIITCGRTMEPSLIDTTLEEIRMALEVGQIQAALEALTKLHSVYRINTFSDMDITG